MDYRGVCGLEHVMAEVNGIDCADWYSILFPVVLLNEEQRKPGVAKGSQLDLTTVVKSLVIPGGMNATRGGRG